MDKYPLIGVSIIAVVLLILGSLTNVVGYQSMKSSAMSESPLFSMRTQRATDQQRNILTSQYLGKGKENLLQFPTRDNKTELLIKAIDFINKMDEKTFARFMELCIQKVRQDNTLRDISHYEIIQALLLLKTNPKAILNSFTNRNNHPITSSEWFSLCQELPFDCIAFNIFFLIFAIVFFVCFIIALYISGPTSFTCISYCICLN
jgi:hypothetical protein